MEESKEPDLHLVNADVSVISEKVLEFMENIEFGHDSEEKDSWDVNRLSDNPLEMQDFSDLTHFLEENPLP